MVVKIDKGVPIPPKAPCGPPNRHLWVKNMEVGDSVLCESWNKSHAIFNALTRQDKTAARRKEEGGVRVWRVT